MNIVITGGSGFIGTNVIDWAIAENAGVKNIDILPPRNKKHIPYWHKANIMDLTALEKEIIPFDPDYIIHLAARTDLDGKSMEDYSANTVGVGNILQVSKKCLNLKKIIITSSMLVCHAGYVPRDFFDYSPTTIYGKSKVITEKKVWENPPECDWAIIRPTSIWGEWFGAPYKSFFDRIMSKSYFHIGHRSCTKTYGYVGNSVYQIQCILFTATKDMDHKVFYIGDNPPTPIEEWANEIASEIGTIIIRLPFFFIKGLALIGDWFGKVGVHFPMTSFRLKNMTTDNRIDLSGTFLLAPKPPYTRVEGIRRTLQWIKNKN